MTPEVRSAMQHQSCRSDCREILVTVFGMVSAEIGSIEWLLDRIEQRPEVRRWA